MTRSILAAICVVTPLAAIAPTFGQAITIIDPVGGVSFAGDQFTVRMTASYGSGDYAMAGIATSILINEAQGEFSDLQLISPMDGPGTTAGVVRAGDISGIFAGQLNFPAAMIFADPSNPIAFWEATFTVDDILSGGVILDIETSTTRYDVYTDRISSFSLSRLPQLTEGSLRIVIPAPASAMVLLGGLGSGLMGLTRRRR